MSVSVRERYARWAGRSVLAVIALLLGVNIAWIARNWSALRPLSPGDTAPTFVLARIDAARASDDHMMDLAALRGDVVLVDFWAEWCRPCRAAMPAIEAVYKRYRDKGFEVISVKTDGRAFGERGKPIQNETSFPIVWDNRGVASRYKVTTIPHLVLVDHEGIVRYVHRGFTSVGSLRADLGNQIEKLLARRKLR